jgi:hypothetical protein
MPETIPVEVEMLAFPTAIAEPLVRVVDVPKAEVEEAGEVTEHVLELVFRYGQNDFQPKHFPSVSVGDVIRYGGARYRIAPFGFEEVE